MTHKDLVLKYTDALNDIADILDLPNGRSSENIVEAVSGMRDALLSASVMRAALDDCRSAAVALKRGMDPSHGGTKQECLTREWLCFLGRIDKATTPIANTQGLVTPGTGLGPEEGAASRRHQ